MDIRRYYMEDKPLRYKRLILAASLTLNLAVLFFFKHHNWLDDSNVWVGR
jgi:hypothetical protein